MTPGGYLEASTRSNPTPPVARTHANHRIVGAHHDPQRAPSHCLARSRRPVRECRIALDVATASLIRAKEAKSSSVAHARADAGTTRSLRGVMVRIENVRSGRLSRALLTEALPWSASNVPPRSDTNQHSQTGSNAATLPVDRVPPDVLVTGGNWFTVLQSLISYVN